MKALYSYNKTKLIVSIAMLLLAIIVLLPLMLSALRTATHVNITPDRSFGYDLEALEQIKQLYGYEGAKVYFFTRVTYDLLWPAIYLFFLINSYAFLLDGLKERRLIAFKALPFITVFFDLLENTFCSIYFFKGHRLIGLIAVFSSRIKWCLFFIVFISFGLLSVYKIYRKIRR